MLIAAPWAFQDPGRSVPKSDRLFQDRSNRRWRRAFEAPVSERRGPAEQGEAAIAALRPVRGSQTAPRDKRLQTRRKLFRIELDSEGRPRSRLSRFTGEDAA